MISRIAAAGLLVLASVAGCGKKESSTPDGASTSAEPAVAEAGKQPAATVDGARIAAIDNEPAVWLSTGRNYGDQRFSPLDKINDQNVSKLGLAWTYKVDVDRGAEATPLVVDGVMYTTGAYSILYALDARTGKELWKYDPEVPRAKSGNACCDVVNRGVAISKGRVFLAAFDGRLIALDAKDGKKIWEVSAADGSGRTFALTGAPIAIKDMVVIGSGGAEFNARGYVSAFDAADGKLKWRWYVVPGDPTKPQEQPELEKALATWKGKKWAEQGGGGTVWNSFSYDPEANLLYFGTGNGVSWNRIERGEPTDADNLFISSLVALKADTGEYAWHYQEVPGDNWDYDATANIVLADLEIGGKPRKVLLHAPKNAFFYVLDRITGELLSAEKYTHATWATKVDLKTGRPVVDQKVADWTKEPKLVIPGPFGAHNWHPMSFSPKTGLVYIPVQDAASLLSPHKEVAFDNREGVWNIGLDLPYPEDAKAAAEAAASYKGRLLAWDPVNQKKVWAQEYPNIWNGGTMVTAGNLVFQGTADGRFVAYSADKGEKLWEAPANSGVLAGAMTYELDGEQYVTVMAGWGGVFPLIGGVISNNAKVRPEARVITFKLGATGSLPPPKHDVVPVPELQEVKADAKTLAKGEQLFGNNCSYCHGLNAVGGGIIPDLRYLTPEKHEMFAGIVAGAKADRGMPSFAGRLMPEDIEAIRQYVIKQSQTLKSQLPAAPAS
ncbi:MAG: PQQ-dependent dehydrogenase, methanol/ethanol family [Panacagrimonas sp.]|nr:PQQ-dependent dehydrogenase, methanol/ethanol family [Panacagrimonas sp.]MCC2658254.1 PQQ-dependent dehydrogenase, methanol/ethanol family [Panacagrimonas sp.]